MKSKEEILLLTQSEYARHRKRHNLSGTTPAAVRFALKTGRISFASGKRIDPERADKEWLANTEARPSLGKGPRSSGSQADKDYAVSRARREASEAELSRMKSEERQNSLIPVAVVRAVLRRAQRIIRAGHEVVIPELAPAIAPETSINAVERILKTKLDRLDTEVAEGIQALNELDLTDATEVAKAK